MCLQDAGAPCELFSADGRNWQTDVEKDWGVPNGTPTGLTSHGSLVLSKLGEFFAQHYSSLLPMQAATTFVYADGADSSRRCVESAESFFRGAFGAAPVRIQSNATFASLLFNQGGLSSPNCPLPTQPELEGQIGGKVWDALRGRAARAGLSPWG